MYFRCLGRKNTIFKKTVRKCEEKLLDRVCVNPFCMLSSSSRLPWQYVFFFLFLVDHGCCALQWRWNIPWNAYMPLS